MLKENLDKVEKRILKACERSGRKREEITLIAVSKTKPLEDIEEIKKCGVIEFGENKVQEMMDKYERISSPVHWHMIGHLQRNKVKYLMNKVTLIHSVDSFRLAEQIDKESQKASIVTDILIEVNIAREDSKFGLFKEDIMSFIEEISQLKNIHVRGLMTSAPFVEDPEDNRKYFRELFQLFVDIREKNIDNIDMDILSMGMTNDFEVAIEEGATMVRIGTAIFGNRNYEIEVENNG